MAPLEAVNGASQPGRDVGERRCVTFGRASGTVEGIRSLGPPRRLARGDGSLPSRREVAGGTRFSDIEVEEMAVQHLLHPNVLFVSCSYGTGTAIPKGPGNG